MRRFQLILALPLSAAALATPARAATDGEFRADFQDKGVCPGVDLCGTGIVHGLGHATTTLSLSTLERVITLDADGSTLRLQLTAADLEAPRLSGTFTVIGGTGVFTGASGSGAVWATLTGVPGTTDTAHYRGTLTLND